MSTGRRVLSLALLVLLTGVAFSSILFLLPNVAQGGVGWGFVFVSVTVGGAVGGLVASIDPANKSTFSLPNFENGEFQFGAFGHILIGAVAGLVFFGLFGPTDTVATLNDRTTGRDGERTLAFLRVAGTGALAGFAGRALIQKMADALGVEKKVKEAQEQAGLAFKDAQRAGARSLTFMGHLSHEQGSFGEAIEYFENALQADSSYGSARLRLAVALLDAVKAEKQTLGPGDKRVVRAEEEIARAISSAGAREKPYFLVEQAYYEWVKTDGDPKGDAHSRIVSLIQEAKMGMKNAGVPVELSPYDKRIKVDLNAKWPELRQREWRFGRWMMERNLLSAI